MALRATVVLAAALLTTPTAATCRIDAPPYGFFNEADVERIGSLYVSRARGLTAALRSKDEGLRLLVAGLFDGPSGRATPSDLTGSYTCRTVRLGSEDPITADDAFECSITREGDNFRIVQTGGPQRLSGKLTASGDGYLFVGARHEEGEDPVPYGAKPDRNRAGCLTARDDGTMVLELPAPGPDAMHDAMVLTVRP